jgi:NAD-dependent deacetylase
MVEKKKLVVITGAGMSAESGIATFRDSNGLWNNHKIEDVATPQGWVRNPALVLDFYNQRRAQLFEVEPNVGHTTLAQLEDHFHVQIITQNVDDLHERAGSTRVLHLHGELRKVRSIASDSTPQACVDDIHLGDLGTDGHQLRPHIVWFGEAVPLMEDAIMLTAMADYVLIVGSSMQVYPAASLIGYAPSDAFVFYIDPNPSLNKELVHRSGLEVIREPSTVGVPFVAAILKRLLEKLS